MTCATRPSRFFPSTRSAYWTCVFLLHASKNLKEPDLTDDLDRRTNPVGGEICIVCRKVVVRLLRQPVDEGGPTRFVTLRSRTDEACFFEDHEVVSRRGCPNPHRPSDLFGALSTRLLQKTENAVLRWAER